MGFADNFVWGAATASYQIEGAAAEDGKGKNIWDVFSHTDGKISDKSNGDIACDHYHKFKEDVKLMSELGLKAYRFSVSWSRIIPDGTGKINQAGIKFYSELIDELLKYGIEPYVTLYHWDLPYALHLQGGWLNDKISDWFAEYTSVCAELFGGRVKNVITFNEPEVFVGCGYFEGVHAPGLVLGKEELLHIGHNVLRSHGKAVRVLREKIPDVKIGFVTATMPPCPVSEKDAAAAAKSYFSCGRGHFLFADAYWIDPVVFGKYPDSILNECADILPEITDEDMAVISSPIDFLGLNIYQGRYVKEGEYGYAQDVPFAVGNPLNAIKWNIVPEALYWGPRFMYERYKLPIYITENGMAAHDAVSLDGKVHDPNRIDFLHRYLREFRKASDDGIDCRGYFQWSFLDNFEWGIGYTARFGMIYTDYASGKRIPKDSAFWYKEVIESNGKNL